MANFLQLVAERYGNPNAVWCSGRLKNGQEVKAILPGEDRFVVAMATGRKKNSRHILKYRIGNRNWELIIPTRDILIEW